MPSGWCSARLFSCLTVFAFSSSQPGVFWSDPLTTVITSVDPIAASALVASWASIFPHTMRYTQSSFLTSEKTSFFLLTPIGTEFV